MKKHGKLALISASMTLSLGLVAAKSDSAQAATVTYDFSTRTTFSGSSNPSVTGYFSFESPTIPDFSGNIPVNDFSISNANEFTFFSASAFFFSGVFQGLATAGFQDINTEETFTFNRNGTVCTYTSYNYGSRIFDIFFREFSERVSGSGGYRTTPSDLCGGSFNLNYNYILARGDVIYSQRSIPESSTMWGLTVLGLAFLLQRKSKFYPAFRYKSVKTDF